MDLIANKFAPLLDLPNDPVFRYFFIAVNVLSLLCWFLSVVTQNFSIIDRIWPIEPCLFAWGFLLTAVYFNPVFKAEESSFSIIKSNQSSQLRLLAITLLVTLWCIRLTYNYWRKGIRYYNWHKSYVTLNFNLFFSKSKADINGQPKTIVGFMFRNLKFLTIQTRKSFTTYSTLYLPFSKSIF